MSQTLTLLALPAIETSVFKENAGGAKPQDGPLSNVVFGGPDMQTLYVTAGDKVFRRHTRRKGFYPWEIKTAARKP